MRLVVLESPYRPKPAEYMKKCSDHRSVLDTLLYKKELCLECGKWWPWVHELQRNIDYARAATKDCLLRGEAPYASHLLYTQQGILVDEDPEERAHGIAAGLVWGARADATVVYVDCGISSGMVQGILSAQEHKRPIEFRSLTEWKK